MKVHSNGKYSVESVGRAGPHGRARRSQHNCQCLILCMIYMYLFIPNRRGRGGVPLLPVAPIRLFFAYLDSNKKRKAICLLDKSQNIQGLNNFSALFTGVG